MKTNSTAALYKRHRYPGEIIAHTVWLYFSKINGKQQYLWRAVDQHGTGLDILV